MPPSNLQFLREKNFYENLFSATAFQNRSIKVQQKYMNAIHQANSPNITHTRDNDTETIQFLRQRDISIRNESGCAADINMDTCTNCAINASCYNASQNLWHPSKCENLTNYSAKNVYMNEKCFNISILVTGDSRGRNFFVGVLKRFYPFWSMISK